MLCELIQLTNEQQAENGEHWHCYPLSKSLLTTRFLSLYNGIFGRRNSVRDYDEEDSNDEECNSKRRGRRERERGEREEEKKRREETEKEREGDGKREEKESGRERGARLVWRKGLSPRLEWKDDERRWR
ncbi:hypothetical protein TNCV_1700751 [Trichonephila clavipes]|nr:hypothetical protein TNCV_1700751 [Trichonephila clavipes]